MQIWVIVLLVLYVIVMVYRLFFAEWQGALNAIWDRDILAFFLVGMIVFGMGIIGEYVGRIYQQVRERPRYTIRGVLETTAAPQLDATPATREPR